MSLWADEGELLAGTAGNCLGLDAGTTTWEITDNFGVAAGSHRLTFGIHGERIDLVENPGFLVTSGLWFFDSLDSLEQGKASGYSRLVLTAADSQVAFRVNQVGVYLQDQWLPTPQLDADCRSPPRCAVRPRRRPRRT